MRIAYLIHSLHNAGGMERGLSVKSSWLAAQPGYEVYIITASLRDRKPYFPLDSRIKLIDLGTGDFVGPALWRYSSKLDKVLCELRPDVCISLGGNEIGVLPCMKDGSVKMAEFHFSREKFDRKYGKTALGRLYAAFRLRRFERAAGRVSQLVVLTEADRKEWLDVLPSVRQIYNPVTIPEATPSSLTRRRFVAVGRLEAQKNFQGMVRVWGMVAEAHPDWTLDIYGEGSLKQKLEQQILEAGLQGKVRLMGQTDCLQKELSDSSGILLSSSFEGFPLCLIEASACGLPLVSYDCRKGPAEIVEDGVNGFLVDEGDEAALASAVCKVIEDEELRASMGARALQTASRFRLDVIMRQWQVLFEELTSR